MPIPNQDFYWQYLERAALTAPDRVTLRVGSDTITARALWARTSRMAEALVTLGVRPGDRVATILPPSPEFLIAFGATNRAGAIAVPLDVRFQPADLRRYLRAAAPRVLVTVNDTEDGSVIDMLGDLRDVLAGTTIVTLEAANLGPTWAELMAAGPGRPSALAEVAEAQRPDDGALIIFTGGSTGVPKAALLSQSNVTATCQIEFAAYETILERLGHTARPKILGNLPPSHIGGALELIGGPVAAGWEVILQERWSPYPVLEAIVEHRVPIVGAVPTMYAILLSLPDLERFDLSCLKLALLSGEKVSLDLLEGVRDRICRGVIMGYGSTEAGAEVTLTDPHDDLERVAAGYVGKPLAGMELRAVDDDDRPLSPGEVGEVLVTGPMTIPGYFRMPEEDEAGFAADGFCRTGDLGRLTEDGGLIIEGRKNQIIRVGSYTVLPSEVEEVVLTLPTVAVAAAIGLPDAIYGEVVCLVVAPNAGEAITESEILDRCREQLADFKVPRRIEIRDEIPMSRVGKVDRVTLRAEFARD